MTHLVYPGAEHTRFQHSLGVMHLASEVFDMIVATGDLERAWGGEEVARSKQLLRLYALLHDLGHAPFSHSAEKTDPEENLFPENCDHETYSIKIISETSIAALVARVGESLTRKLGSAYSIEPADLEKLINGAIVDPHLYLLRQLMNSELDVDKMDYLLRDSHYCGVAYGLFDLPRLKGSLTVYTEGPLTKLAVDEGGIHVVEAFILARYYMFTQVYFHRTRRILDYILRRFRREELPGSKLPHDTEEFLEWDDVRVASLIRQKARGNQSEWAARLEERRLLRLVRSSPTHASLADRRLINVIEKVITDRFGKETVFVDRANRLPHRLPRDMKEDPNAVLALNRDGEPVAISESSEIVRKLSEPINILRIYAKEDVEEEVQALCDEYYKVALKD